MPFVSFNRYMLSDLVVNELDPAVGYARQDLNVTPPAAGAAVDMGTVVFRTKASTNTDETPYAVISASSQLVNTNEFAVVYGNEYSCQETFVPRTIAPGRFNAVGYVGKNGALSLKEWLPKMISQDEDGAALTDAQFEVLRQLLKDQGIILETTLTEISE